MSARLASIAFLLFRPGRLIALGLLGGAIAAGIVFGPWITAQARAVGAISTAYDTPLLAWVTDKVTDDPVLNDTSVSGVPVTVARPSGEGPWPAIVILNGATQQGRFDPDVVRLSLGLARVGHLVVIMDAPGVEAGQLEATTLDDAVGVMRAVASRSDAAEGEVSLVGLGLGGTMALLAAQRPGLAARIPVVVAVSPLTDLTELGRLATTGYHRVADGFVQPPVPRDLVLTAANSVLEALPDPQARRLLEEQLNAVENRADPLGALDAIPVRALDDDTRAVIALLSNQDPRRYDQLYDALPRPIRATVEELFPVTSVNRIRARIEIAAAPDDPYVPLAQAQALQDASVDVHVTISDAFRSTSGRPELGGVLDFFRLDGLVVRALYATRD